MIGEYDKNLENWLKQLNWSENPFVLKIDPSLFVGYQDQLKKLTNHIREGHKVALITGSTGSGKTTMLKLVEMELKKGYEILYIAKPPRKEDLASVFLSKYRQPLFQRIFGPKVKIHDLHVYLNSRLGQKKLIVLLDETHEADVEVLKWFRTISDQVEGMQLVLAGLSTVEDLLRKNLETLRNRVVTHIELLHLSREDSRELIAKRIASVGGSGITPFTEDCLNQIYGATGGFPREILKICDKLVQKAIDDGRTEIDGINIECETLDEIPPESGETEMAEKETKASERPLKKDFMGELSYKQRKIIKLLDENKELFPSDIVDKLGFDKYKTKQHAVRSVNNILNRLSTMGYVDRKPLGKGYVYFLNVKTKNLLIKS